MKNFAQLNASGLSSSAVSTMVGQVIMQGFVGFRIPLWLRLRAHPYPPLPLLDSVLTSTQFAAYAQGTGS
jgi:manganese transport protein